MANDFGGGYGQYLPALSHLLGEVESPTQTNQMQSPQFGGQPGQLGSILGSPHVQQLLQQFGINFDPNQIRQSPFFPNHFMQQHPHLGAGLSAGMANAAATPEAPLVSGAGSGITRAMQGMMGGPELQRQYQIRQMMAPFQAMGAQIPGEEFGRKQQLLDLLTKMEQDRQQMGQAAQQHAFQQPQETPYGLIMPGAQTPVPPEMQGQSPRSAGLGTQPLMGNMFPGQGLQQFQQQGPPNFQPYDPKMLQQQTNAQHPERQATADLKEAQAGTEPSKQDLNKAKAGEARKKGDAAGKTAKSGDAAKWSKQYNDIEKQFSTTKKQLDAALAAKQIDQNQYNSMLSDATAAREESKSNTDKARGDPGASGREMQRRGGLISPNAPVQAPGGPQANRPGKQQQNTKPAYQVGGVWYDGTTHQPIQTQQPR